MELKALSCGGASLNARSSGSSSNSSSTSSSNSSASSSSSRRKTLIQREATSRHPFSQKRLAPLSLEEASNKASDLPRWGCGRQSLVPATVHLSSSSNSSSSSNNSSRCEKK
ncbi:hypothetical protein Emag_000369 [Eimeria magna]